MRSLYNLDHMRKLVAFADDAERGAMSTGSYRLAHLIRLGSKSAALAVEECRRRNHRKRLEELQHRLHESLDADTRTALTHAISQTERELEDTLFDRRRARYALLDQTAATAGVLDELANMEPPSDGVWDEMLATLEGAEIALRTNIASGTLTATFEADVLERIHTVLDRARGGRP